MSDARESTQDVLSDRPNEIDLDGDHTKDAFDGFVAVLAHELRNPLASMQGCAQTLLDKGEELPAPVRVGLAEVIVRHTQRMDWLVRATAMFAEPERPNPGTVDLADTITEACEFAQAEVDIRGRSIVYGDRRFVRTGAEAALLALGPGARAEVGPQPGLARLVGPEVDLRQPGRRWKLRLANRVVRALRGALVTFDADGSTVVELRFIDADEEGT